jgi:hypothetical protein
MNLRQNQWARLILVLMISFAAPSSVRGSGSLAALSGFGSFSAAGLSVNGYGFSISARRDRPAGERSGELALSYISNSVGHPLGQTTLNTYTLDLRRRFSGQFGTFAGLEVAYFASGNENNISSGLGLAPQLGYDLRLGEHSSVGLQGQWFIGRNFPSAYLTLKLSN